MSILEIIGLCSSIVGIILFIVEIVKWIIGWLTKRVKITWKNINKGVKKLIIDVQKLDPDIIVTLSGKGSIVCNWINSEMDNRYPVYTCLLNRRGNNDFLIPENWEFFSTKKWIIYVPDEVLNCKDKKILFIDDVTITGETLKNFEDFLIESGMAKEQVFTMTLYKNSEVKDHLYDPDYYWKEKNMRYYNPPWGKSKTLK